MVKRAIFDFTTTTSIGSFISQAMVPTVRLVPPAVHHEADIAPGFER